MLDVLSLGMILRLCALCYFLAWMLSFGSDSLFLHFVVLFCFDAYCAFLRVFDHALYNISTLTFNDFPWGLGVVFDLRLCNVIA